MRLLVRLGCRVSEALALTVEGLAIPAANTAKYRKVNGEELKGEHEKPWSKKVKQGGANTE
jgi:hypothetical protein